MPQGLGVRVPPPAWVAARTRGSPDARRGRLHAQSPHPSPRHPLRRIHATTPPAGRRRGCAVCAGHRGAGRERGLDRLRQGRQRLPDDARRRPPVPGHVRRRLQRRLAGRRRHDDRAHGINLRKLDRAGQRARRLRHARLRHAPGAGEDVLRAVRPGHLARRHEGGLHVLLHDAEPEPDLLPAHVRHRDQRGRHGLQLLGPHDRLGRAGPAQALRLALPGVGRQHQDGAVEPDAPAQRRRGRRRIPEGGTASACSRAGSPTRCRTTRASAAATSPATRRSSRSRPARTTHADRVLGAGVPSTFRTARTTRRQPGRLLPLQRPAGRRVRHPDVRARRQPDRVRPS